MSKKRGRDTKTPALLKTPEEKITEHILERIQLKESLVNETQINKSGQCFFIPSIIF